MRVTCRPAGASGAWVPTACLLLGAWLLALAPVPVHAQGAPEQVRQLVQAGLTLKRDRKFAAAAEQFRAAARLDPGAGEAHWGLAWCYVSLGKDEAAVAAFQNVIRLAPNSDQGVEAARAIERLRLRRPGLGGAPAAPQTYLLVVVLEQEGRTALWLADAQGSSRGCLTTEAANETQPSFASDGRRLVFVSDRTGNRDLWLRELGAGPPRPLTTDTAADYSPAWSPRGEEIVFVSEREGSPALWLTNVATAESRPLGLTSSTDPEPAWSPRGDLLALVSDRDGQSKLCLWDPLTGELRKLLATTVPEQHPVWDAQGAYLYFTWNLEGHSQTCRVRPTGEGLEAVAPTPDNDRLWAVSPNDAWRLVSSDRSGQPRLYLREPAGPLVRPVTTAAGTVVAAAFSPWMPESVAAEWFAAVSP